MRSTTPLRPMSREEARRHRDELTAFAPLVDLLGGHLSGVVAAEIAALNNVLNCYERGEPKSLELAIAEAWRRAWLTMDAFEEDLLRAAPSAEVAN